MSKKLLNVGSNQFWPVFLLFIDFMFRPKTFKESILKERQVFKAKITSETYESLAKASKLEVLMQK